MSTREFYEREYEITIRKALWPKRGRDPDDFCSRGEKKGGRDMTKQEAIRLLRTETPGDSEWMELAKQMGASALEKLHTYFVTPKCEKCGRYILGVEVVTAPEFCRGNLVLASSFDPAHCPTCNTPFVEAVLNCEDQTCVLKGPKEANT